MILRFLAQLGCGALFCAGAATQALAQVSEVRIGVTEFDERTLNLPGSIKFGDENSVGLNAEIIFEEPEMLKWALTPQPYINGTLNLGGGTPFGGAGLMWRQTFSDKFYADFSFGAVIHDGTTEFDVSTIGTTPEDITESLLDYYKSIEFGSRVLFREQVSLGLRVNEDWAGEVFIEHLSNGTLIGNGTNDAVNSLGVKASRRF